MEMPKKITAYLKSYSILAICYTIAVFLVKLFEALIHAKAVSSFSGFLYGNLISCGFIAALVLVIYLLFSLWSNKTATYIAAVLLGIMMLTELGLVIYYHTTGILMGKELIVRPLWETIHTIKSAISLWMLFGVLVLLGLYVFVNVWLSKKNIGKYAVIPVYLILLASIPLFLTYHINQDNNVVNKVMYCIKECANREQEFYLSDTGYDEEIIDSYLEMFPEREILDKHYPLEREDNIQNVLGPYFKKAAVKPNIVVIIVESLGTDLLGYTPFIDSLANQSLCWKNCMATTPRSFGAVPAITASVPHGLKGFQFGDIPAHNSIISILAKNGYATNAFYAGNFSFDRIYDYLVAQDIDYLSPLRQEYNEDKSSEKDGTYWGYHDEPMFNKSMDYIEKQDVNKPSFNLFVTISQHEDLKLCNKELEEGYYNKALTLGASQNLLGKMAATLYADDAVRHFMKRYGEYDKSGNTIFVITGDHSMNLNPENPLDAYHVPLIIWSPLLEKPHGFEAMVSHNDITPSLLALLRDNFGIETPETVCWVSEGLDTLNTFHSDIKNYFLHYSRSLKDFVWNDYYYTTTDKEHPVWSITDGVNVQALDNPELSQELDNRFRTMVYVDNYVYSNDKLLKNPVLGKEKYELITSVTMKDSLVCASKKQKPSIEDEESTRVYYNELPGDYSKIKLTLDADVKYTENVWQDAFISLIFECNGSIDSDWVYSTDYVSKYILSRTPEPDKWQKLSLTKIVSTGGSDEYKLKLYLKPTHKDDLWNPNHSVTLKNIKINVWGVKKN